MDGYDDIDMGYTPARPVARPFSDIFHYPWDGKLAGRATAVKPEDKKEQSLLQKLAEMMDKCGESRIGGCDACPSQRKCDSWWSGIEGETTHGRTVMTQEIFEMHKAKFATAIKPAEVK